MGDGRLARVVPFIPEGSALRPTTSAADRFAAPQRRRADVGADTAPPRSPAPAPAPLAIGAGLDRHAVRIAGKPREEQARIVAALGRAIA